MKNNLHLILPLLRFDLGSYHVQIIQRSKDGHDRATRIIADWYIKSQDKLEYLMKGIELLCREYNARCYINLNPKSDKEVSWEMADALMKRLRTGDCNPVSTLKSCHDSCDGNEVRYWIVDVDDKSTELLGQLYADIRGRKSAFEENIIELIETKNGYHIITVPFDRSNLLWPKTVEVKKNSPTLLCYI